MAALVSRDNIRGDELRRRIRPKRDSRASARLIAIVFIIRIRPSCSSNRIINPSFWKRSPQTRERAPHQPGSAGPTRNQQRGHVRLAIASSGLAAIGAFPTAPARCNPPRKVALPSSG
jgi:hypothetical protein